MMQSLAQWDHRLRNRLTAIKLALQLLDRKTELSTHQRALAQQALDATDTLALELFGPEGVGRPHSGRSRGGSSSEFDLHQLDRPASGTGYDAGSLGGSSASSRSARRT
jgi:hypothetical protein